ncbi:hypothetical protein HDU93_001693 [Gonapodya sp. JEL0774]|nr:hypothetical protein HDU93_001693 [Gonapodya sp. JEL0774]
MSEGNHSYNSSRSPSIYVGLDVESIPSTIANFLDALRDTNHDFAAIPLLTAAASNALFKSQDRILPPFSAEQLYVDSAEYSDFVTGRLSPVCLRLDSADSSERHRAEQLVKQEVAWAGHIGLASLLLPTPGESWTNYARVINQILNTLPYVTPYVSALPLAPTMGLANPTVPPSPKSSNSTPAQPQSSGDDHSERSAAHNWERWNALRSVCDHNSRLAVALEVTPTLPSPAILASWQAEPVKCLVIQKQAFLSNPKGYPVLSKRHQQFVRKMMEPQELVDRVRLPLRHSPPFRSALAYLSSLSNQNQPYILFSHLISGSLPSTQGGITAYSSYIRHLWDNRPELDDAERFAKGYRDHLQAPLQPLMDNLESSTYEVFEKDPVKYEQYEKAIYGALVDRVPENSPLTTTIMVLGAGRGPLVDRALRAADSSGRAVRVFALEKNLNAVVGLNRKKKEVWGERVTVVFGDMRGWQPEFKADILVSELLGSFGDNELSPECLHPALPHLLKPDGISIPSSYSAYISPLQSHKLHMEVAGYKDLKGWETPYVVKFGQVKWTNIQKCWTFEHVHGLAGFFDAVLYKDVIISIHPDWHSPGMFSWFPIFFPLRIPVFIPANQSVQVNMWRVSDTRKVWYEWMLIMGSPGSGKGTQTERMMKHYEMEAISSGDLLRKHIKGGTEVGKIAQKIISEGGLVPDDVMVKLMIEELQNLKDKTLLLDGFPRTLPQAEALDSAMSRNKMPLDLVINLDVPPEVILQRIEDRWVHIPSGRVYNLSYNPPKVPGKDDVTGEPLSKRPDDNVDTFKKRLDNYFSMTKPLITYYEKQGKLRNFHGETSDIIAPQIKDELAIWYDK